MNWPEAMQTSVAIVCGTFLIWRLCAWVAAWLSDL